MSYKVLTDYWKSNLSSGDVIPDTSYSEKVLKRAVVIGYIELCDDRPTMENTKKEIEIYLDQQGIEYDEYATKSELLRQIK